MLLNYMSGHAIFKCWESHSVTHRFLCTHVCLLNDMVQSHPYHPYRSNEYKCNAFNGTISHIASTSSKMKLAILGLFLLGAVVMAQSQDPSDPDDTTTMAPESTTPLEGEDPSSTEADQSTTEQSTLTTTATTTVKPPKPPHHKPPHHHHPKPPHHGGHPRPPPHHHRPGPPMKMKSFRNVDAEEE